MYTLLFLKIVKIKFGNKPHMLFLMQHALITSTTKLFKNFHLTHHHRINQSFPCRYGSILHKKKIKIFKEYFLFILSAPFPIKIPQAFIIFAILIGITQNKA
jgi:hypothetical protein